MLRFYLLKHKIIAKISQMRICLTLCIPVLITYILCARKYIFR